MSTTERWLISRDNSSIAALAPGELDPELRQWAELHNGVVVVPEQQLQGAVDRVMLLEAALLTACSDGWPDGESVAAWYVEKARAATAGGR